MGHPMPAQHTSVVLRPHFKAGRTLLALAMAAVVALSAGVVILISDADQVASTNRAAPAVQQLQQPQAQAGTRYDGGPEEGTRGAIASPAIPKVIPAPIAASAQSARYDGGPEEGTRGPQHLQFNERAGGPTMIPQGPGAR
jgi:hypothetical protein